MLKGVYEQLRKSPKKQEQIRTETDPEFLVRGGIDIG